MPLGKHQYLGNLGGSMNPAIIDHEFRQVLRYNGQNVIWKRRKGNTSCICFDANYGVYASDCEICGGNGNAEQWETQVIRAFIQFKGERVQGNHQPLYSKAGLILTQDAVAYIEGKYWDADKDIDERIGIKDNDAIIWDRIEYRIVQILPRLGNSTRPIFLRLDLERHPYQMTDGDVNVTV